ncbi:J domain-containing protein [Sulfitobacter sp.]|uniref:J domain-containing protein n=1 Tax=Sulfitobacter sp. TaxID=1903071 RepID=UPI0030039413
MQPILIFVAIALGFTVVFWIVRGVLGAIFRTQALNPLGVALISTGILLFLFRAIVVAVPLMILGLILLSRKNVGAANGPAPQTSTVRSIYLEMTLDHDSGKIDGCILAGERKGQFLSNLDLDKLLEYYVEIETDNETVKLLQTFLDNAHPDWRDQEEERSAHGQAQSPLSRELSQDQAYEVLGLDPGCTDEDIRKAYHRLIKRVHPDSGGSAVLMAQVTEAKDRLLGSRK